VQRIPSSGNNNLFENRSGGYQGNTPLFLAGIKDHPSQGRRNQQRPAHIKDDYVPSNVQCFFLLEAGFLTINDAQAKSIPGYLKNKRGANS